MDPNLQLYERIPDQNTTHKTDFNPYTYYSIQDRVNNDTHFQQIYFQQLTQQGWVKLLNNQDILRYPPGSTFKYKLNGNGLSKATHGTFRSGGFLLPPTDSDLYINYKAFNGCIFPLQLSDVLEFYVKDPSKEIVTFNPPKQPTKHVAYLTHPNTKLPTPVYYANKPKDLKAFTNTNKFKKALRYGNWQFKTIT
jgi:hypothetical protein